jgi:3-methyladenine DNA glycosylase AlkD
MEKDYIKKRLYELKDSDYKLFNSKLIPTVDPDTIIGVRMPKLRRLAKELSKDPDIKVFINNLPHTYYEENNLHGLIIEGMKDYNQVINYIEKFLPYIDNWATCDLMKPKIFKKHLSELIENIKLWINSDKTYTIRFGIGMLMTYYLDDRFNPKYHKLVAEVKSGEYYVNMMIAWYFATALAKQWDATISIIENNTLDKWVHNKTIQKAVESYRIDNKEKEYLKTFRRK